MSQSDCYCKSEVFLHADCKDGDRYMQLRGQLAELMVLVDSMLYREYVHYSLMEKANL